MPQKTAPTLITVSLLSTRSIGAHLQDRSELNQGLVELVCVTIEERDLQDLVFAPQPQQHKWCGHYSPAYP